MSWVSVDQEACNACGICVSRCPRCFSKQDGRIATQVNEITCNLCGHCVALCPTNAVLHHKMDMKGFVEYAKPASIDTDTFIQFARERRSHRWFRDKTIPRPDLETLIEVSRHAPTGSNVQSVNLVVVQDEAKRQQYSDLTVDYFVASSVTAKQRLAVFEAEGRQNTDEYQVVRRSAERGDLYDAARKTGFDPILYKAPAVMIFHSVTMTSTPKDNAVIASTTVGLAARTMGIESCYIGLLEIAANNYPPLQEALDLPVGHRVQSVLVLGYPRMKFLRAVDRKPVNVRWD